MASFSHVVWSASAALLAATLATPASGACPDLAALRSPAVAQYFSATAMSGIWYENRYTDLAQIGARCQMMNKTTCADGICEDYRVLYGDLPFDLPLVYNSSGLPLGVSARYLSLFPELSFPSVVVDVRGSGASYSAAVEYLCWTIPGTTLDYVEVRISTREPQPSADLLANLTATAWNLGVRWSGGPSGGLTDVNFTGCEPWGGTRPTAGAADSAGIIAPIQRAWTTLHARGEQVRAAASAVVPAVPGVHSSLTQGAPLPAPCSPTDNATDVILPGQNPGMPQLALIFIQGATVVPSCYSQLLARIQTALPQWNVIAGAPAAPILNTPDPLTIGADVARVVASMQATAGLDVNSAKFVYAAHSLGGEILQGWLVNATLPGHGAAAVVLLGSYITRPNRAPNDTVPPYFAPTLSMTGEQDGLARVSRFAEAFWHQQIHATFAKTIDFPVLIIPGMNHGQFGSFSGQLPGLLGMYDLPAEAPHDAAQTTAANNIALFISSALTGNASAQAQLASALQSTQAFLQPLIDSQIQESYYNLLPPCYDNPPSPACIVGCPWSERAQAQMGNAAGTNGSASFAFGMTVVDAMHPVDDLTPIHLPNFTNNCTAPTPACTLDATTVTQQTYDPIFSDFDVALYPVTAHETRVKMTSRQNAMLTAGYTAEDANFTLTDGTVNLCAEINAETLAWAVRLAGNHTAARYHATGLPMIFGADQDAYIGPQFTYGNMNYTYYNASVSRTGAAVVVTESVTLRTPVDYIIPEAAGFHYCLLLSPARAMEWVYVDSQRTFLLA